MLQAGHLSVLEAQMWGHILLFCLFICCICIHLSKVKVRHVSVFGAHGKSGNCVFLVLAKCGLAAAVRVSGCLCRNFVPHAIFHVARGISARIYMYTFVSK